MYANVRKTQSMKYTFLDGFLIRKGVRFRTAAILNGRTSRIGCEADAKKFDTEVHTIKIY